MSLIHLKDYLELSTLALDVMLCGAISTVTRYFNKFNIMQYNIFNIIYHYTKKHTSTFNAVYWVLYLVIFRIEN